MFCYYLFEVFFVPEGYEEELHGDTVIAHAFPQYPPGTVRRVVVLKCYEESDPLVRFRHLAADIPGSIAQSIGRIEDHDFRTFLDANMQGGEAILDLVGDVT